MILGVPFYKAVQLQDGLQLLGGKQSFAVEIACATTPW